MQPVTLYASNFRGLRDFQCELTGPTLLLGPNGSGKTSVILLLRLLRAAYERGLGSASYAIGGSYNLRTWGVPDSEPVTVGLGVGTLRWQLRLVARGPDLDFYAPETLHDGGKLIFTRDGQDVRLDSGSISAFEGLAVKAVAQHSRGETQGSAGQILGTLRGLAGFQDLDRVGVREHGSNSTHTGALLDRAQNALTVLRGWMQDPPERARFDFVTGGLRELFPRLFHDLGFQEAGTTLVARVFRPQQPLPSELRHEADGLVQSLLVLTALAAGDRGSVIAIDEPDACLHPSAIRGLASLAEQWSQTRGVIPVFTSHSPVLADAWMARPERVYVFDPAEASSPRRLSEWADSDWIARHTLGELLTNGQLPDND